MLKKSNLFYILYVLIVFCFNFYPLYPLENSNIKIDVNFSKKRLKRGGNYKLLISFKLNDNYLFNYYPILNIRIEGGTGLNFSKKTFKANEVDVKLKTVKNKKYIDEREPIIIPLEVQKDVKRGRYKVIVSFEGFITNIRENYVIKFQKNVEIDYKIY